MRYHLLWEPSKEWSETSRMNEFLQFVNRKFNKSFMDYFELYEWSVNDIADFWDSFGEYSSMKFSRKRDNLVDDDKKMPGAKWFEGARMNFAENLLSRKDDKTAIIFRGEAEF